MVIEWQGIAAERGRPERIGVVIEVTKLTSDEPVKWKLMARELPPQP
jgi:hypothetical protein